MQHFKIIAFTNSILFAKLFSSDLSLNFNSAENYYSKMELVFIAKCFPHKTPNYTTDHNKTKQKQNRF